MAVYTLIPADSGRSCDSSGSVWFVKLLKKLQPSGNGCVTQSSRPLIALHWRGKLATLPLDGAD